jgi:hypothetical protein
MAFNLELTRFTDLRGNPHPQPLSTPSPVIVIHKDHRAYYTAHHPQKMQKRCIFPG